MCDADAWALFQPHRPVLARIGDARLRELGFADSAASRPRGLKDGARLSQTELARWAKVEQPTMAQLCAWKEMALSGREADPNDRRRSLVALTDEALAKLPAGRAILGSGQSRGDERFYGRQGGEPDSLERVANAEDTESQERRIGAWAGLKDEAADRRGPLFRKS